MQARIEDIGDYGQQANALYMSEEIDGMIVNINTEAGRRQMAIYDSVWRYVGEQLENDPSAMAKSLDMFKVLYADYISTGTKAFTLAMGQFVVNMLFGSIVRSSDLGVKLFNITVDGATGKPKQPSNEFDAYLSMLDEPEEIGIPIEHNVQEVKKKQPIVNPLLNQAEKPQKGSIKLPIEKPLDLIPQIQKAKYNVGIEQFVLPTDDGGVSMDVQVLSGTPPIAREGASIYKPSLQPIKVIGKKSNLLLNK